jgi:NADPH-dependent 2,4-dienoyl-CoA reductase/sulfur reductase-like enzyme/rhodanese-related sulfurtransferase
MERSDFVIVGGVACGPKTAATLARRLPNAKIILFQKDDNLSYAVCGLPYLASGDIGVFAELTLTPYGVARDAEFFKGSKGFTAVTGAEVTSIDRTRRVVTIKMKTTGETIEYGYDKLVLATGASPALPDFPIPDDPRVRTFQKPEDALVFRRMAETGAIGKVVIVGGGLIGCELVESAAGLWGLETTLVEKENQILSYVLDPEMAAMAQRHLESQSVKVITGCAVDGIEGQSGGGLKVTLTDRDALDADFIFLAMGLRPNVKLARQCGLMIGRTGGIKVDNRMCTSDPNIFAGGDCVESVHRITGEACFISMGSLANRHGRVIAEALSRGQDEFRGVLGTCFLKLFDYNLAATGLTELQSTASGFKARCVWGTFPDKPDYHPEKQIITAKMVYDGDTERLLGLQAVGRGDTARRADVFAALLQKKATIDDLFDFEHGYAPTYSEALDPLHHLAGMARACQRGVVFRHPARDWTRETNGVVILDVRETEEAATKLLPPVVADCGATIVNIPLGEVAGRTRELVSEKRIVVVCQRGSRSYQAALFLREAGFENVEVLGGGLQSLL